jgi:hypothetical protein
MASVLNMLNRRRIQMAGFKILLFSFILLMVGCGRASSQNSQLRLVFIRHAERPDNGDNLTCRGLNRSLLLPGVLFKKFGKATAIYVPSIKNGTTTKRGRMLQTISPYAIKYGLSINSAYEENDAKGLSASLVEGKGTILIVWEHRNIAPILRQLGIRDELKWPADDFDSIWIVTFRNGKAVFFEDKENLRPAPDCPF